MRTSASLLAFAAATVFQLAPARAAGPVTPSTTAPATMAPAMAANSATLQRALDHQLNKHVVYPLLERQADMTGVVEVSFVVNTEGRIEVIAATSENDALCDYVLRKLGKVDIGDNPSGTWKTSHVRFVFRPEA